MLQNFPSSNQQENQETECSNTNVQQLDLNSCDKKTSEAPDIEQSIDTSTSSSSPSSTSSSSHSSTSSSSSSESSSALEKDPLENDYSNNAYNSLNNYLNTNPLFKSTATDIGASDSKPQGPQVDTYKVTDSKLKLSSENLKRISLEDGLKGIKIQMQHCKLLLNKH